MLITYKSKHEVLHIFPPKAPIYPVTAIKTRGQPRFDKNY